MFGIEGLGLEEMASNEVSGKHKESGYSDKLKELVKESLGSTLSTNSLLESDADEDDREDDEFQAKRVGAEHAGTPFFKEGEEAQEGEKLKRK